MLNDFWGGLCPTCEKSIRCDTWAEWKCLVQKSRYHHNGPMECADFKKRSKDFKAARCQCEDCLKNESLSAEFVEVE